jgi:hypothetical protein
MTARIRVVPTELGTPSGKVVVIESGSRRIAATPDEALTLAGDLFAAVEPMPDVLAVARNIVNQLGDLWSERIPSPEWVKVRQETNDLADEFVIRLIATLLLGEPMPDAVIEWGYRTKRTGEYVWTAAGSAIRELAEYRDDITPVFRTAVYGEWVKADEQEAGR